MSVRLQTWESRHLIDGMRPLLLPESVWARAFWGTRPGRGAVGRVLTALSAALTMSDGLA